MRSHRLACAPVGRARAAAFAHVRFVLGPELLDRRQHRRGGGVAEGTERLAGDVVRDAEQQIDVRHRAVAAIDLVEDPQQPVAALAARDFLTGGTGADVLNGGDGVDTASYLTAAAGLTVSLTTGTGTGDAQGDTFICIENLTGSGFTDTLVGAGVANVLDGGGLSTPCRVCWATIPMWLIT